MRVARAFTLVELLVVIGIIAVLISVLLPALRRARQAGNATVCMNNLRMLGVGLLNYVADNKGFVPWEGYAEGDRAERSVGEWDEPAVWFNALPKYARQPTYSEQQAIDRAGTIRLPKSGDRSWFVCPEAGDAVAGDQDDVVDDGYFMMWGLDAAGVAERRRTYWCYGYNTRLDGGIEDRNVAHRVWINIARVKQSSIVPILIEKIMRPNELSPRFATSVAQQEVSWKEFTTRHQEGGYILMLDGHVGYFKRRELIARPIGVLDYNKPDKIIWNPFGTAG
jgi:prepilin-type N-terminal cleavage/methylation domain-containing protein/prepilin-type processing-associated H-X9-DG protein